MPSYTLKVLVLDPTSPSDKMNLQQLLYDGWTIGGVHKPSIFSRKTVFYLQRKDEK